MVSRRFFLGTLGVTAAGIFGYRNRDHEVVSQVTGPPETNTEVATITAETLIRQITFYASGAAEITLKEDHSCYNRITLTHADSDQSYEQWDAPEFAGPITVDLKGIIQANGPYPRNEFQLRVDQKNGVCIATGIQSMRFAVPESYLPE